MSPRSPEPATVICHYRVKPDREAELLALIRRHEEVVRRLAFVTDEPTRLYRGTDEEERPYFVKIFEWRPGAVERAHEHPEVLSVWERMEPLCEPRDGRPGMEFPHVEPVKL
jgi:hypothetical protein